MRARSTVTTLPGLWPALLPLLLLLVLPSCGSSENEGTGSAPGAGAGGAPDAGTPATPSLLELPRAGFAASACGRTRHAVVTDIDATLTQSDANVITQLGDATYDPPLRPGGPELLQGYAERGFWILYLTSRPETLSLAGTGEPLGDATRRWLDEHGFPRDEGTQVLLAPDATSILGEPARIFKAARLADFAADGFVVDHAYGNADSDVHAYADAGLAKEATYIIGPEAGLEGTVAVAGDGWTDHAAAQLPTVQNVCAADR